MLRERLKEYVSDYVHRKITDALYKIEEKQICIEGFSIEQVQALFVEHKENNPCFGVIVDDCNYLTSGQNIRPSVDITIKRGVTDTERHAQRRQNVNTNLTPFVFTQMRKEGYTLKPVKGSKAKKVDFYDLYLKKDIESLTDLLIKYF